jgi:glycosyltransferase involved in cell wall biosynthesis
MTADGKGSHDCRPLRILHLVHMYHPTTGGMQIHMRELTESILRVDPRLALEIHTSRAGAVDELTRPRVNSSRLRRRDQVDGVSVRRYRIWNLLQAVVKWPGGVRLPRMLFGDAIGCLRMGPFVPGMIFGILRYRPDLVLLMNAYNAHAFSCYVAKRIAGFKLVTIPSLRMEPGRVDHAMVDRVLHASDRVIALSEYEKRVLVRKGIDEAKIEVIGVGVRHERFSQGDGDRAKNKYGIPPGPVVGFLGRKIKGKGAEHVVQAMSLVWEQHPDATLLLAGSSTPGHRQLIHQHLAALSPSQRSKVVEVEAYAEAERADLFSALDVFVMPSNIDSFGIVYLEAWSCGKPVIACTDSAPSSIVEAGSDGLLVEYGNIEQIAAAINRLLDDPVEREAMGKRGYEKVLSRYSWPSIARATTRIYRELVGVGGGDERVERSSSRMSS